MKLDFELKLPKKYISYSQMNTYLWDPADYYAQYFLGKDFMEEMKREHPDRWDKIRLGSIFQDAWYDPRINWRKKLKADGFTSDKERIIETALEHPKMIRFPTSVCEKMYTMDYRGVPILIKPDGWKLQDKFLIENKFGSPRGQENVDEDLQISFYCLGIKLKWGFIPNRIVLQSVNDRTGRVDPVETKRTESDLKHVGDLIIQAARGISMGVWEK